MDLPKKHKADLPPKPYGGGAAGRLQQFEMERGEAPTLPESEETPPVTPPRDDAVADGGGKQSPKKEDHAKKR